MIQFYQKSQYLLILESEMKKSLFILIIFLIAGCELKSPVQEQIVPTENYDAIAAEGWTIFTGGTYDSALVVFDSVIVQDPENTSARVGRAWCLLMQADVDTTDSRFYLQAAESDSNWFADARCGGIIIDFQWSEWVKCIAAVDELLAAAPQYVFKYHPQIDWHDMRVIQAQSHYFTKNYEQAWATLEELNPGFQLDPDASETWIVDGVTYFSFEAALSKAIEMMSQRYSE